MIVCSCNLVTKKDIEEVVRGFLEKDAWQLITVGMLNAVSVDEAE